MDFLSVEQSVWRRLQKETRPIALYGMGDGADKILAQFDRLGIRASAVFASDEFARGNLFHGFCVRKLSDTVAELGEDHCNRDCVRQPETRGAAADVCPRGQIRRGGAGRSGGRGTAVR